MSASPLMNSNDETCPASPAISACAMTFAMVWVLLGLAAFVRSLLCFGRSGTMTEKILGLFISWLAGPLYFFYAPQGYCQ